ncbi:hypothetical protein [Nocardiopsis ganjiahuensis]|uniref:hypothetical protein n=1 Tax=Nocardiopsis ganjiahuensis TaxID=239984 RepID=UPI000345BA34|nr:hypothetical protein [Nocardiopsis ganjiahuensis]
MEAHTRTLSRTPTTPAAVGGPALLVVGLGLTLWAWNAAVPDPARHQIFLSLWLLGVAILAVRLFLDGLPTSPRYLSRGAVMFGIGTVAAAAVTTMPWSDLGSVFWYQLWFSVPLLAGLAAVAFRPSAHRCLPLPTPH